MDDMTRSNETYLDGDMEWSWYGDEYYANTDHGWVAYSEMKPWLDLDDVGVKDPSAARELGDLYASFESRVRTFKEARDAVHEKGKNRGYFRPRSPPKGKGKGKPKGKGVGKAMMAYSNHHQGRGSPPSGSPVNKPGYSGCFICGSHAHGKGGSAKPICMVTTVDDDEDSLGQNTMVATHEPPGNQVAPMVDTTETIWGAGHTCDIPQNLVLAATTESELSNPLRYAVVDTGATETVASLDAVEHVMATRYAAFGAEDMGVNPKKVKKFRFGNAQERFAESFVTIPQTIKGMKTSLGVCTMDVPNIPVLLGVKSMIKLGAVVNVGEPSIMFTKVFPGVKVPLIRGKNGHLLLDLCKDWAEIEERKSSNHAVAHLAEKTLCKKAMAAAWDQEICTVKLHLQNLSFSVSIFSQKTSAVLRLRVHVKYQMFPCTISQKLFSLGITTLVTP